MLANGAKLGYSTADSQPQSVEGYTDLPGLKQIPDMGEDPEWVDNTVLTDSYKTYELGIGDYGDLQYTFKYNDTSNANDPYRLMKAAEAQSKTGKMYWFCETLRDGTTTQFPSYVSVKRNGGGVNGVIEFTLALRLGGQPVVTYPAASASGGSGQV